MIFRNDNNPVTGKMEKRREKKGTTKGTEIHAINSSDTTNFKINNENAIENKFFNKNF